MVRGDLETYKTRGWCRLEVLSALTPKKFSDGSWRPGPIGERYFFHQEPDASMSRRSIGPLLRAQDLLDPLDSSVTFTCCYFAEGNPHDCDRDHIKPVVTAIAAQFADYLASGSTAWNLTLDMSLLPVWLGDLIKEARSKNQRGIRNQTTSSMWRRVTGF